MGIQCALRANIKSSLVSVWTVLGFSRHSETKEHGASPGAFANWSHMWKSSHSLLSRGDHEALAGLGHRFCRTSQPHFLAVRTTSRARIPGEGPDHLGKFSDPPGRLLLGKPSNEWPGIEPCS